MPPETLPPYSQMRLCSNLLRPSGSISLTIPLDGYVRPQCRQVDLTDNGEFSGAIWASCTVPPVCDLGFPAMPMLTFPLDSFKRSPGYHYRAKGVVFIIVPFFHKLRRFRQQIIEPSEKEFFTAIRATATCIPAVYYCLPTMTKFAKPPRFPVVVYSDRIRRYLTIFYNIPFSRQRRIKGKKVVDSRDKDIPRAGRTSTKLSDVEIRQPTVSAFTFPPYLNIRTDGELLWAKSAVLFMIPFSCNLWMGGHYVIIAQPDFIA